MGIGDNIYYNRSRVGLSQEELAELLNVPVQSVLDWEEKISKPNMDQILQMCGAFSCSLDSLLIGETEIKRASEDFVKEYERQMITFAHRFSEAVGILFFGAAVLLILMSLGYSKVIIALCVSVFGVIGFIIGLKACVNHNTFVEKYPQLPIIYTKEQIDKSEYRLGLLALLAFVLAGVSIFVLVRSSTLPVLSEMGKLFSVGVFLIGLGVSVTIFLYAGIRANAYDIKKYNKENAK